MEQKSIIIIDDDKFILNVFSRILQKEGYIIDVAETGQEALERLKTKKYDLALIDIKLPDIDGKDLVYKLKTYPMKKIVITGFPSIEDATEIMDNGAATYLVKPVKSEELIKLIKEKLNQ